MSAVGDKGYTPGEEERAAGIRDAALIRKATAVAVAIANASQLISNYKKQRDIQSDTLTISEEERKHAQDVYWPRELEFLREFTSPEEKEEAEAYGRRFAGRLMATVAGKFAQSINKLKCNASRYCSSEYVRTMQTAYQAQTQAIANAKMKGYITGFAYWKALNDRDDQRRLQAIGIGKGLMEQAASLYTAAGAGLGNSGAELTATIGRAIEGFGLSEQISINSVPNIDSYIKEPEDWFDKVFQKKNDNTVGEMDVMGEDGAYELRPSMTQGQSLTGGHNVTPITSQVQNTREGGNNADVGPNDLVRTGVKTYPVVNNQVTVYMKDFPLKYADRLHGQQDVITTDQ